MLRADSSPVLVRQPSTAEVGEEEMASPFRRRWRCEICQASFWAGGRHHCRSCGQSVCDTHFARPFCAHCANHPLDSGRTAEAPRAVDAAPDASSAVNGARAPAVGLAAELAPKSHEVAAGAVAVVVAPAADARMTRVANAVALGATLSIALWHDPLAAGLAALAAMFAAIAVLLEFRVPVQHVWQLK
jgi:hypothetical protein